MAQKRMFSNSVVESDDFIEMPDSSQNLYFHLSMHADDDGFIDNWKSIMRMIRKTDDDLKILIAKSFIIPFDTGVIVIRHWRLNNYIQKDRYKETIHKAEKASLSMDKSNVYNMDTECIHSIDKNSIDKNSIDKNSIDKNSIDKNSIDKISIEESSNSSSVDNLLYDPKAEKLQDIMIETIGSTNINNIKECINYLDKLPFELIEYALRKTARVKNPSWQYTIPILESYISKKFKTLAEVEADDLNYKSKNKSTSQEETKKEKVKYTEIEMTEEEYAKRMNEEGKSYG